MAKRYITVVHPQIEQFFTVFREAVALGADMELRLRMLADKTPPLDAFSTAKDMASVEEAILEHFGDKISDSERRLLRVARKLRNKLVHGDFTAAVAKLDELGHPPQPAAMYAFKMPDNLTLQSFLEAAEKATPFAVDETPNKGHLAAWHMQLSRDGSLAKAAEIFRQGISLIDLLAGA
jgi:hypothetical protein